MRLQHFRIFSLYKCFGTCGRTRSFVVDICGRNERQFIRAMSSSDSQPKRLVAICQVTSTADKSANYQTCQTLIADAVGQGAKMVFLPEAFDYLAENKEDTFSMRENLHEGPTMKQYRQLAKELNVWLSLGGFHQTSSTQANRLRNSHVIIAADGSIASVYDKLHLFDVDIERGDKKIRLKESDRTEPGGAIVPPVSTPVGKVGLAICYDLRFPEMSLALAKAGAEILTFPSAFTVITGQAHWEILLRNKAIENQCYVIAAAQTGKHNDKRSSYGHSMIIDPWGRIIASIPEEVGVAVAEINLDYLRQVREELPVWSHRRSDIYGAISIPALSQHTLWGGPFDFGHVKIAENQLFLRSQTVMAFVNIKPVVPGHVLVAPIRAVERLTQLLPQEVADLFSAVQTVQRIVEQEYEATSSTITIQDGPEAGQTIKHVHVHILPRKSGDFEKNDNIYAELDAHDKSDDGRSRRSPEDMADEATRLRALHEKMIY